MGRLADKLDPLPPEVAQLPFCEFVERASMGRHSAPIHFARFIERLAGDIENLRNARDVWAAPCQHGKTTLVEYAIAWLLLRHPERSIMYITYVVRKAEKHSRRIRTIYLQCGGRIQSDFNTIQEWRTEAGGGLFVTSADGEVTGNGATHIFYDDPYSGRDQADSAEHRELIEEKFSGEVMTRLAPGGSITIIASRWHEDDLSGVCIRGGYVHVHLRAIETVANDNGEIEEIALCPWGPNPKEPRTLEWLRSQRDDPRMSEHNWLSLFQGEPRARNAGLFHIGQTISPEEFGMLDTRQHSCGYDLAWSSGNDWIAITVLAIVDKDLSVVIHHKKWQKNAIEIEDEIRDEVAPWPNAMHGSYVAGPEVGAINVFAKQDKRRPDVKPLKIHKMIAKKAKHVRARSTAQEWNKGLIRVLDNQPWTTEFMRRVKNFTGLDKDRDDEVDSLVSARDTAATIGAFKGAKFGMAG